MAVSGERKLRGRRSGGHDYHPSQTREAQLNGVIDGLELLVNAPDLVEARRREHTRELCSMRNKVLRDQMKGGS